MCVRDVGWRARCARWTYAIGPTLKKLAGCAHARSHTSSANDAPSIMCCYASVCPRCGRTKFECNVAIHFRNEISQSSQIWRGGRVNITVFGCLFMRMRDDP